MIHFTNEEISELARQEGIDPQVALDAVAKQLAEVPAKYARLRDWQRANTTEATIIMRLYQRNEANLSLID